MKTYLNEDKIDNEKPGIIVMSHGPFAIGLVQTAEVIYGGKIESVAAISLDAEDNVDDFRKEFLRVLKMMPEGSIALLDIFGGSPSNQFLMSSQTEENFNCFALAGVNVPIFLNATFLRNSLKGDELLKALYKDEDSFGITDVLGKING